ncbi:Na/Pi symporter (plasmid) [Bacillus sp. 31A1R]|uniref:Na/Pi symporter n=1 Tax=Robertmurraya mangrovi TaxID=3098077 RepID=A0ABU5IUV9_9BACI|nr:Na/Pi symporter [Bacillus sp. 31A1R]MDZ5470936.1 Na/Pi symporter [Bacillus sp. 31A1R]
MLYLFLFIFLITIFIIGMTILRTGLFNVSGDSLKGWILKLTDTPWKGLLVGTIVTGILQSSSAVMVMTIGLISARMLTFRRSIGIILGTNIGTTFTTEFITFNIDSLLIPMAIIGTLLIFWNNQKVKSVGFIFLGISFVFSAMTGFEYLANPIASLPYIEESIYKLNDSYIYSVLVGIVITSIIQSSTATTGIIMGFLSSDILTIGSGIAIMLGSNVGTCVTAFIASIGGGKESKLCAYAHIWLNVIGVLSFYPLINYLAELAPLLASEPDVQLAHISVVFNVISSLLVVPFANLFARFITKIHG